ncbi:MAG: TonB-dependent receptor [Mucilaginibacter polytrichastri]|nr:TonB-dependent receptor [Mucilaginibacter polytrichastri]
MIRKLLFLCLFISHVGLVSAQNRSVNGKVTSQDDGSPLPGVSVMLKGTTTGTQTDQNGNFTLTIPSGDAVLVFRYVGFSPSEVPVKGNIVNVKLKAQASELSEVVVVGYGSQLRRDLTGSVAKVTASDIKDIPLQTFESGLQGRAAGVFINSGSGKLGQALQIRVRGITSVSASNQPLFVIDGVPIVSGDLGTYTEPSNPLAAINPDDIESMEVLKDAASAAIYGSRGSNGVVLITTKKGREGRTNVTFGTFQGFSDPTRKGEFLNAAQYRELFDEAMAYGGYDGGDYANAAEMWQDYTGTDDWNSTNDVSWVNQAFRKGYVQQYNVGVNGGDAKTRFALSGNFNDNKGILIGNRYTRTNGRISLDHTASKILEIGGNINFSKADNYRVPNDNAFSNPLQLNALPPIQAVYGPDGQLNRRTIYYNNLLDIANGNNLSTTYRMLGTTYANLKITKDLTFRSEYGLDFTNLEEEEYYGRLTEAGGATSGYGFNYAAKAINFNTNNTLNYLKTFGEKHSLNVLAGFSFQNSKFRFNSVTGNVFPSDRFTKIASAAIKADGTSSETAYTFLSYLARVNYKYADKYLVGATVRTDASSRFGADNRYGTFPSVSAGWIISEEEFLKDNAALSFLKLRASYGLTGNAEIGNFASRTLYTGVNYAGVGGTIPSQLGDRSLTWETTKSTDIALDFGLLKDRISGSVDLYLKQTSDLLLNVPIPATNGFTTITQNIGDMQNKGLEVTLNSRNFIGAFSWSSSFNISFNRNKVTRLANGQPIYPGGRYLGRVSEGMPFGYFYGRAYAGVDPDNGDALYYVDASRTATTTNFSEAADQYIGNPNPQFFGGLGNKFSYKNFDLDIQTQFVSGVNLYNAAGGFQSANGDYFDNQTVDQLRRWQQPGDITDVPQARFLESNGTQASSRYVQSGSYFRVKSVMLGYNLPKSLITKVHAQNIRVYASALNLFTFTNYTGYDPEINTTFAGTVQLGHDFYTPPQARTITFGINVGF